MASLGGSIRVFLPTRLTILRSLFNLSMVLKLADLKFAATGYSLLASGI
jgi:hypothetical protein